MNPVNLFLIIASLPLLLGGGVGRRKLMVRSRLPKKGYRLVILIGCAAKIL